MPKYRFISDIGHGWLEVPIKELLDMGIENKITNFSYMKGDYAFLEEDCDATTFAKAKNWSSKDISDNTRFIEVGKESIIRTYEPYNLKKIRREYVYRD